MGMLIHSNSVGADRLTSNLKTGTISLPLADVRELSAGDFINASGNGGLIASDTTPALSIVNGGHRLTWVATNVDAVAWQIVAPVDFDETAALVVHIIASEGVNTDHPVMGVSFIEGQSNSSVGGNTAAITNTTPVEYTRTIAANALTGGNQWTIKLTPGAHNTSSNTVRVDAVYITYTRKS